MTPDKKCASCDTTLIDESAPCPNCGDTRKTFSFSVKSALGLAVELGLEARDEDDRLRREYQSRTDGTKEGVIDRDLTGHDAVIRRSGTRTGRLVNFNEETTYVRSFVSALNTLRGRSYEIEKKDEEDSGFPDRWIIDRSLPKDSEEHRVGVEVTHLDQTAIGGLGRDKAFDLSGSINEIAGSMATAVTKKRDKIEKKAASQTFLLLTCPYPLLPTMHSDVTKAFLATSPQTYFREVWVAPFKELAFRIL
jgi:hypothetical protein